VEGRKINWMKAGILEADRVLTVSPYYAEELISGEARGCELDNIMRLTGITGIVNGMDVTEWDPSKDKYIAVNYDATTVSTHPQNYLNVCCLSPVIAVLTRQSVLIDCAP
jgi:granule-bound starch synthase